MPTQNLKFLIFALSFCTFIFTFCVLKGFVRGKQRATIDSVVFTL